MLWFSRHMNTRELDLQLRPTGPADAGELLTLQRAAFITEAQVYGDPHLPALVQTLADLERELATSTGLKAVWNHRMVGAIRGRIEPPTCYVGRLVVAPDLHGRGIGTRLMTAFEQQVAPEVERFELYIGSLSMANLRLYERLGYREFRRERTRPSVEFVFMEKPAASTSASA